MTGLTRGEMIILYLAEIPEDSPDRYWTSERRSAGRIADDIGISRAHVTIELTKLEERGEAVRRLTHVQGHRKMLQAWYLTREGRNAAADLSKTCGEADIDWMDVMKARRTRNGSEDAPVTSSLADRLRNMRTLLVHGELTPEMMDLLIREVASADGDIPRILHLYYGDM